MPTVSTFITEDGTVTVTVESEPETDGLAYLALEAIATESAKKAVEVWRDIHKGRRRR